ncbi:MAG: protoheme IX farnesyltransferase [Actinobacteria bacterium]|nr:protoheme IX farnesyltransferase [Actinomycetota bacterium]NBY15494.1 protoheme IX farnesyltransferase [Actinomycetota bacterium]
MSAASTNSSSEVRASAKSSRLGRIGAYVALTKPRIIELLLVTTIPTMFLAADGFPPLALVCWTVFGGALAAAGSNVLNCYWDRDIDALMHRTENRPSATGEISGAKILTFGALLSIASFGVLWLKVNSLSAWLGLGAITFYVVGYTMVLKRRTAQNIVWGGAAGCMPVLIGWAAVQNKLTVVPLVLFLIIFFWTPPHYWPLSLRYREDYARADIPMLPVVASDEKVANQIIAYSWVMVAVSWTLNLAADMSIVYDLVAMTLGGFFLAEGYALRTRVKNGVADLKPMRLFHWSITYLSLLFLMIGLDPFIKQLLP